jgi:hypothetical protein
MEQQTKQALINSAIAAGLVFFGCFIDGEITKVGIIASISAAGLVFLTKMRDYFGTMDKGGHSHIFEFL